MFNRSVFLFKKLFSQIILWKIHLSNKIRIQSNKNKFSIMICEGIKEKSTDLSVHNSTKETTGYWWFFQGRLPVCVMDYSSSDLRLLGERGFARRAEEVDPRHRHLAPAAALDHAKATWLIHTRALFRAQPQSGLEYL